MKLRVQISFDLTNIKDPSDAYDSWDVKGIEDAVGIIHRLGEQNRYARTFIRWFIQYDDGNVSHISDSDEYRRDKLQAKLSMPL
jgi:hypothetical protein